MNACKLDNGVEIVRLVQDLISNLVRKSTLYLWISFLYLKIFTPRQAMAMTIHA